jgi:hypothetical protein
MIMGKLLSKDKSISVAVDNIFGYAPYLSPGSARWLGRHCYIDYSLNENIERQ